MAPLLLWDVPNRAFSSTANFQDPILTLLPITILSSMSSITSTSHSCLPGNTHPPTHINITNFCNFILFNSSIDMHWRIYKLAGTASSIGKIPGKMEFLGQTALFLRGRIILTGFRWRTRLVPTCTIRQQHSIDQLVGSVAFVFIPVLLSQFPIIVSRRVITQFFFVTGTPKAILFSGSYWTGVDRLPEQRASLLMGNQASLTARESPILTWHLARRTSIGYAMLDSRPL